MSDNHAELWKGDFSFNNLTEYHHHVPFITVKWYHTKNELIDAMIKRLEQIKNDETV